MSLKVERSLTIAAPPERVWQAWVAEINNWWGKPYYNDHARTTGLILEPHLGGRFFEQWGPNGEGFLIGQVVEWLPPISLAYTWTERDWEGISTLNRLHLEPIGNSSTKLTYTQAGFERLPEGANTHAGYEAGWGELSNWLKNYVEKGKAR